MRQNGNISFPILMETQEKNNHLMKLSFSQSVMRIEQKLLMFSYGQFYIRLEMLRKCY